MKVEGYENGEDRLILNCEFENKEELNGFKKHFADLINKISEEYGNPVIVKKSSDGDFTNMISNPIVVDNDNIEEALTNIGAPKELINEIKERVGEIIQHLSREVDPDDLKLKFQG
jgi:hypothetical protein